MSDDDVGRELPPRDAEMVGYSGSAITPVADGGSRPVDRFSAGPRAHAVGLTEDRSAQIVRQSGNARIWVLLAILLIGLFIPVYWLNETGVPALGYEGRMAAEAKQQLGGDLPDLAPVPQAGTADEPRVIRLELTASLEILDDAGAVLDAIAAKPGETIRFELDNTAGFSHNLYIGDAQALAADQTIDLPGAPPFSSGVRSFDWIVPADGRLQFACTIPGHYTPMHGDIVIQT